MRRRVNLVAAFVAVVGMGSAAASGETFEALQKRIEAASKKVQTFSARIKTVTDLTQPGYSMKNSMVGTTEMLRKGEIFMVRMESSSVSETEMGGESMKTESKTLMISDGEFTYTLNDASGTKLAYKSRAEPQGDPFKVWRDYFTLKVLPDASVAGRAVWVVEASAKQDGAVQGTNLIYYDKESGQLIKMVANGPDGKPVTTTTYTDIKVNGKISADRFVFKAPPGVKIEEV